jgi:uncharacterized protein YidB (DUF937 family)
MLFPDNSRNTSPAIPLLFDREPTMFQIIRFILSLFGAGTKAKIKDAITGSLFKGMTGNAAGGPLGDLMKQFQIKCHGNVFGSWVGTGANQAIDPDQLQSAIGEDKMREISQKTGLAAPDLAKELARYLPTMVDRMTPSGRLPGR